MPSRIVPFAAILTFCVASAACSEKPLKLCESDEDCFRNEGGREGTEYLCDLEDTKRCVRACGNEDCLQTPPSVERCRETCLSSQVCILRLGNGACSGDGECGNNLCDTRVSACFPSCTVDDDCNPAFFCDTTSGRGMCKSGLCVAGSPTPDGGGGDTIGGDTN